MSPPHLTIRARFAIVAAAIAVPLLGALVYAISATRADTRAAARRSSLELAQLAASGVSQFIGDSRVLMRGLAARPGIQAASRGRCDPVLRTITLLHPEYANVGVVSRDGFVICSAVRQPGGKPTAVSRSAWFRRVSRSGRFTVGDPYFGPITHRWVSVLAMPIRRNGETTAYLALPVDLALYQRPFRGLELATGATITVLDRSGRVVARTGPPGRPIGRPAPDLVRLAEGLHGTRTARSTAPGGVHEIYGIAPLPFASWRVFAGTPVRVALRDSNNLIFAISAAALFALLLGGVAVVLSSRRTVAAIRALALTAARAGRGESDVRAPVGGPREVALAARELNAMIEARADAATTQRKLSDALAQSQKLEAVGRVAGSIAHDFNNLLVAIDGFTKLALKELPAGLDGVRADLAEATAASARAGEMTRQLLAFSRRQALQPRTLELNRLTEDSAALLGQLVGDTVSLRLDLSGEPLVVEVDPTQMDQVLLNLVVNARDAMPDGGEIVVATRCIRDEEGERVALTVTDTGVGIPESLRTRIFEPFFTTKDAGKGTGFGLATVYGIVTQSGGSIVVESEVGRGSTFTVFLPRAREPLFAPAGSTDAGSSSPPRSGRLRTRPA